MQKQNYSQENLVWQFSNRMLLSLYIQRPNGRVHYDGEQPVIGKISFDPSLKYRRVAQLLYFPSPLYEQTFSYTEKNIGLIDLEDQTHLLAWDLEGKDFMEYDEEYWKIPARLIRDTDAIVKLLGLRPRRR